MYWVEKVWKHEGLRCVVVMADIGHRCGYVGVPEDHILYGLEHNDAPDVLRPYWETIAQWEIRDMETIAIIPLFCHEGGLPNIALLFDVHGGITFSRNGKYPVDLIYDRPWWFGFDCGHAGDGRDLSFVDDRIGEIYLKYPISSEVLRTTEDCVKECEKLAQQLTMADRAYRFRRALLQKQF